MTPAENDDHAHGANGAHGGRLTWVRGAAAAALAVLLVAAAGAGVFRGFTPRDVDRGDELRRAAAGALGGAAAAALAIAGWNWYRHRRGLAAGSLGGATLAALLALLIGGGATLGASTTPEDTSPPAATGTPPDDTDDTAAQPPDWSVPEGGAVLDATTGRAYVDTDGDGILDTELVPCPPAAPDTTPGGTGPTSTSGPTTVPPYRVGDKVRVAIDNGCDGVIDRYIYVTVVPRASLPTAPTRPTTVPTNPPTPTTRPSPTDASDSPVGSILLIMAGLAVLAVLILALRGWHPGRGRPAPLPDLPQLPEDLPQVDEEAVADSLADSANRLLDDPDPRRAIIAAYAALLDGLAAAGAPRATYEAPEEHLQRALRQLGVPPAPLSEVTRLFLIARFSSHPLGEADRHAARRALTAAEQELRLLIAQRADETTPPPPPGWAPPPPTGWAPPR